MDKAKGFVIMIHSTLRLCSEQALLKDVFMNYYL